MLAADPKACVLALSAYEDTAHPQRVLCASALDFLTERSAPETLLAAAR